MAVQTPALKANRDIVMRRRGGRETLNVPVLERLRQGSLRPAGATQQGCHINLKKKKSNTS